MQGRILIVDNASHFPPHNPCKNRIYTVKHLPAASEILMEINPHGMISRLSVSLMLFQKQLRPCQPEFINTLLHIPHHKTIVPALRFPADAGEQILLHQIAVLILVNQDLMKTAPVVKRRLRRHITALFLPHKNL